MSDDGDGTSAVVTAGSVVSDGAETARLVEREAELRRFDVLVDATARGVGGAVVIGAPAGFGKTALLRELERRCRDGGFHVLSARGRPLEGQLAFGVVRQLLEPALRRRTGAERRRLLAGVARVGAGALGFGRAEVPEDRFAAMHGLFWLCANLADSAPVLVAVDDLQWSDDASAGWVDYLGQRCHDLRVLLAVAVRAEDPVARSPSVASLVRSETTHAITLAPLELGGVTALVRSSFPAAAAEFCAASHELTGGSPLFVRELLAAAEGARLAATAESVPALRSLAPRAVGSSVLVRLAQLGDSSVPLARAVAVLGDGCEAVTAATLAAIAVEAAEVEADRLSAARILAPGRPLEFVHPVVAAAVYADIPAGERRLLHRRAAEILARDGHSGVATHLLECSRSRDEWVVERLVEAATDAAARGAPAEAAVWIRRALAEPPTPERRSELLPLLATAEWRAGEGGAVAHLEEALAQASDEQVRLALTRTLAYAYLLSDRAPDATALLEQVLGALPEPDAAAALELEGAIVGMGQLDARTSQGANARAARLRTRLAEIPEPPVNLLAALAANAARTEVPADQAQALAEQALASDPYPPPLESASGVIAALVVAEAYEAAHRVCGDLAHAARLRGASRELVAIATYHAWSLQCAGALADAEAEARWVLEQPREAQAWYAPHALASLLFVLTDRGALEEAELELDRVPPPPRHGNASLRYLEARGHLRAAQGRLEEALADLLACGECCEQFGVISPAPRWRSEAAVVLSHLGDGERAVRLADEAVDLARAFDRPRVLGTALRARGLVSAGSDGLARLRDAVATLEKSQARVELARARCDYGTALRRAGKRRHARVELERALDLAHHCAAARIANRARTELLALGAKPRRDAYTGRDALTSSELRVARLAAQGLTNREIAQALFITRKTASAHLSRAYRKLGITSRAQLGDALGPIS